MPRSEAAAWRTPVVAIPAVLAVIVAVACATAEPAAAEVLTLAEALSIAHAGNLSLKASEEEYEAAKWAARSASASLGPQIFFSSTATRVDPETFRRANSSLDFLEEIGVKVEPFLYETTYETGFSAQMALYNGQLWAGVGAASAARDARMHAVSSSERNVSFDTKRAYFQVLRAEALVEVTRDAVEAAEGHVMAARRKNEVGLVPLAEVLRWEVVLANDEKGLADAENAVVLTRTGLSNVLGVALDSEYELERITRSDLDVLYGRYEWLITDDQISEEEARALLAGSPDFLTLSDAARASEATVAIARGAFYPSLSAGGSYGWKADGDLAPDDATAWSVRLALDIPVFTSMKNHSDYQESKRSHLAALNRQQDAERALVAGLRNTVATITSNMKFLAAAEKQMLQAEDNLRSVTNLYNEGMAPYTDFVDGQVLSDRSRVGYVDALYEAFLAFAAAERLLGEPPTTSGETP